MSLDLAWPGDDFWFVHLENNGPAVQLYTRNSLHQQRSHRLSSGHATNQLARRYISSLILLTSAIEIGCYVLSIGYDHRFVFLFPFISLLVCNLIDNHTTTIASRRTILLVLFASCYVFALPFAAHNPALAEHRALELIDEMIMTPFLIACLGGIWIILFIRSEPWSSEIQSTSLGLQANAASPGLPAVPSLD